jgi:hypothetical protein
LGKPIEQLKLRGWLEQREMLALAVDIDEQRADLRQDRHRGRSTVQPGATSPSGVNLATENEQAVALVDLELLEHT